MSKVYRYMLDNQDNELVTVEEELVFIRSYIFLMQIRFSPNLAVDIDVEREDLGRYIPPLALQILIENAIKHNEISGDFPLVITVSSEQDKLVVTNNLQLRKHHETLPGTGLKNIRSRYEFFTAAPVEIISDPISFVVKIPILTKK